MIETILVVIAILVIPLLFTINTGADKSTTEPSQPVIVPEVIEDISNSVKPKPRRINGTSNKQPSTGNSQLRMLVSN